MKMGAMRIINSKKELREAPQSFAKKTEKSKK